MMNRYFGFILAVDDYERFIRANLELIEEISKNFKKIYVINVSYLKLRNKNYEIKNQHLLPNNFFCFNFYSSREFLNFFKNKDFVAIQYLDKNPDFFKIFFLIKLAGIKNIMIMNLGNFGLSQTIDFNPRYIFAFKHYYLKGFYYLFRIMTILNIFPKIDLLFESNIEIINSINKGYMKRIENKFPFLKISYFRRIEKVNSLFYDNFVINNYKKIKSKKDKILYVDVPIDHGDRVTREGPVDKKIKVNYYNSLNNFLINLSKILNMKVVIGVHPSNKDVNNYFSNFEISEKRTLDLIKESEIIVVTHSSLISMMALLKKKIISIRSKYLGNFHKNLSNNYARSLKLFIYDIDKSFNLDKEFILTNLNNSIKYYEDHILKYVKVDDDNLSNQKIIKRIKEIFFLYNI